MDVSGKREGKMAARSISASRSFRPGPATEFGGGDDQERIATGELIRYKKQIASGSDQHFSTKVRRGAIAHLPLESELLSRVESSTV